jgi:alpha-D-xyloside xylohydrolase
MFRSHGTDAPREIWRFGEPGNPFYDAIAEAICLRYRLLPYIYSVAAAVTFRDASMLRALALQFPDDPATHSVSDQFFFGPSLMVCPVTQPMHYGRNSQPICNVEYTREVYLPRGRDWYDFWSGELLPGGQTIHASAPLNRIPLYVPAGSFLVMTDAMQYVGEIPGAPYEFHIYTGEDAAFMLYEDDGDGYAYESGACATMSVTWHEVRRELSFGTREGTFPSLIAERDFHIVFHTLKGRSSHTFRYSGREHRIPLDSIPQTRSRSDS